MANFRFLHISDLHFGMVSNNENFVNKIVNFREVGLPDVLLGSLSQSRNRSVFNLDTQDPQAAYAAAAFANDYADQFDAAIFTGDLAATGRADDLSSANRYLTPKGTTFFSLVNDPDPRFVPGSRPIFMLAGNHDRYHGVSAKPNSREFDSVFRRFFQSPTPHYSSHISKGGEHVSFIFGDFCFKDEEDIPGENPMSRLIARYGSGFAYADVIDGMVKETLAEREKRPGTLMIWCVHFAPFECKTHLRFFNYPDLIAAARGVNVKIILCGHTHEKLVMRGTDPSIVVAGTAMCSTDRQKYIHIIDINWEKGKLSALRENYQFDPQGVEFVEAGDEDIY